MTALTNYHECNSLKQHRFMVQEVKSLTRSHWTKIKVLEGLCSFLELLEEN